MFCSFTHQIINKSDRRIYGWVAYHGEVKGFSCRTDEGYIEPGQSLMSNSGWCVLRFVQVQDSKNTLVADPHKILKIEVGNKPPGEILFGAPILELADGQMLGFVVSKDSVWEYNGEMLLPVKGVIVYSMPKNPFGKLKIEAIF